MCIENNTYEIRVSKIFFNDFFFKNLTDQTFDWKCNSVSDF